MNAFVRALAAGVVGAVTTNLAHEVVRRTIPNAPRVDLLGMQALAKFSTSLGIAPPAGRDLYIKTLVGDLISNSLYFSLCAVGGPAAPGVGLALGIAGGVGAFILPPVMQLDEKPTARTTATKALTTVLYAVGGFVAGSIFASGESE